jgi:hypothetical protein
LILPASGCSRWKHVAKKAWAESLASENASRLAAMQRAEESIKDVLEKLNRTFHRVGRRDDDERRRTDVTAGWIPRSRRIGWGLTRNTQDVVTIANQTEVIEPPVWDIRPG